MHLLDLLLTPGVLAPLATIASVVVAASDRFRALCVSAGVPRIRLHSVRHSLALWLHDAQVAPVDAAAFLGHTVEVHLGTYLPDRGGRGIAAAAQALAAAQTSQQAV